MFSLAGIPVMKTGNSLLEILHRENPVFITGMGLQCSKNKFIRSFFWKNSRLDSLLSKLSDL